MKKKVFLGGTCNDSTWRENLISQLEIDYFNPVVPNWTEECKEEEIRQRLLCDYCLYVITPKMTGTYSIAEAVDDSNKRPERTVFCVLKEDEGCVFDSGQLSSLKSVANLIYSNGGNVFTSLEEVSGFLNNESIQ